MIIIENIEIEKFRSCRLTQVTSLGNLNLILGKNNAGKSNILRSLSLFFTNQVEPDSLLNILNDCSAKPKEKKRIKISVKFKLSKKIKIQKTIGYVEKTIPRDALITKEFLYDPKSATSYSIDYYLNHQKLDISKKQIVDQFLTLFNFRYITAARTPKSVLEENLEELKSELKFRLNRKYPKPDSLLESQMIEISALSDLFKISKDLFEPIKAEIIKADKNIENVSINTPDNVIELLNSATYQISTKDGGLFDESLMGSGIQSLLLFTILYLIDKNYHRKFGWKIATIWAIEEPEIFLHFDLENQLANYLSKVANTETERFQIFCTSHSPTFPQYADCHLYVKKTPYQTTTTTKVEKYSPHEFLHVLYENRISNLVDAITLYPMDVILLTEGVIDKKIIQKILKERCPFISKIFSISEFFNNKFKKGESFLCQYLLTNSHIINKRLKGAGIIALFDWDVEVSKINKLKRVIKAPNMIYHFNQKDSNPLLDKSFRGIEKYYPIELILDFEKENKGYILDRGLERSKERYQIDIQRYDFIKGELLNRYLMKKYSDEYFQDFIDHIKSYFDENYLPIFCRNNAE